MLPWRLCVVRGYSSLNRSKLTHRSVQKFSIGKYLRVTEKTCPKRNRLLGEYFCQFASCMYIYTNPLLSDADRSNAQLLHIKKNEAISKLNLRDCRLGHTEEEDVIDRFTLASTGEQIPADLFDALHKWKYNAFDEVTTLFKSSTDSAAIDDTIVDFNYALIGWYLQTYGMHNALQLIEWLGLPVMRTDDVMPEKTTRFWPQPKSLLLKPLDKETRHRLDLMLDGYNHVEHKLQYQFKDKSYLLQAFLDDNFIQSDLCPSHRSLDFIGDSIGNYVIVRHLFQTQKNFSADDLANIVHHLISNSVLATVAVRNQFHKYLRYTSPDTRNSIASFLALLQRTRFKTPEDFHFVNHKNFVFEVPEIIPDSFEALIAGIYFDSSMSLEATSSVMLRLMQKDIEKICEIKPKPPIEELLKLDPRTSFSEPITIAPGQIKVTATLPKYQNKHFDGFSRDAKLAKWAAAKSAVRFLKQQDNEYVPKKARKTFHQSS